MQSPNLLPAPRSLKFTGGTFTLPVHGVLHLDAALPRDSVLLPLAGRLQVVTKAFGAELEVVTGPVAHPRLSIRAVQSNSAPAHPEGYALTVSKSGLRIDYREWGGLRAAVATLCQLLREYSRRLPCLIIRDHPDFARRGVMLDVSRGRVPNLQTLMELTTHLAGFKINEFQLYLEHTFAYRNYEAVWRDWGALTGEEMLKLDAHCRSLGIDLVPNQNSFGHMRYWLEHPPLRKLAEISTPYEGATGDFLRYPTTLAPNHPGTLKFLRGLYDELLPHFTSRWFNVGCDETWDLGRGQSKALCERRGRGRVYVDFLRNIHREVKARDRQMMFWGDIVLHHPELIKDLPKEIVVLNWGYEADHPFERETATFAKSGVPFYVCPGTATWMSLIGRHDTAFANLQSAADAGRKNGAAGYLNTDWGDGGHPQPLAVSYAPYLVGASVSWCAARHNEALLQSVLSRDVFEDSAGHLARAALALGFAHRKFGYREANITPYGAVIAAPQPEARELFCRSGLKYYARIAEKNIRNALAEVESQRATLRGAKPATQSGEVLRMELDLATRMAAESCRIMLWQQALSRGRTFTARQMAKAGIRGLQGLDRDLKAYWPLRNKATPARCSPFLSWRKDDYQSGLLHFPPEQATLPVQKSDAAG